MYLLTVVIVAAARSALQSIVSKPYVLLAFHRIVAAPRRPRARNCRSSAIVAGAVCHSSASTRARSPLAAAGATISSMTNGGRWS